VLHVSYASILARWLSERASSHCSCPSAHPVALQARPAAFPGLISDPFCSLMKYRLPSPAASLQIRKPAWSDCLGTTSKGLTPASCFLLQALMACGITAGTGDTSWPHLRNQANPWQAQVLSAAENQTVDGAAPPVVASVCCACRRIPCSPSGLRTSRCLLRVLLTACMHLITVSGMVTDSWTDTTRERRFQGM
jgi:hypothetical protein